MYNQTKGKGTWKFNNSLLHDKEYVSCIKKCIRETVNEYSLPCIDDIEEDYFLVNPHTFGELLKCKIKGNTIPYSSF